MRRRRKLSAISDRLQNVHTREYRCDIVGRGPWSAKGCHDGSDWIRGFSLLI